MKTRLDFVSNSSSSSFVLVGVVLSFDEFVKAVEAAGWKRDDSEDNDYYEDGSYDDFCSIKDWIEKETKFIKAESAGDDYGVDEVLVGANPSKMGDNDTLKDFKLKIIDELKKVGIDAKLSEIDFESGGSDASGISWIGSCG